LHIKIKTNARVNFATSLCKSGFEVFKRFGGNEMNIQKMFRAKITQIYQKGTKIFLKITSQMIAYDCGTSFDDVLLIVGRKIAFVKLDPSTLETTALKSR